MGRALGFVGILVVVAVGLFIYSKQVTELAPGAATGPADPRTTVDLQGVRNDLLRFSKIEQQHLAMDGHYVSLSEILSNDTGVPAESRGPYRYSIDTSGTTFTATATYDGEPPAGVPRVLRVGPEGTITSE